MHFPSFDLRDPVFEAFGFSFSVQVVTLANVYGIDPAQTSARQEDAVFVVRAAGLSCAGQQERAPGAVVLRIEPAADGGLRLRLKAKAREPICSSTLLLRGLATPLEIGEGGATLGPSALGESFAYASRAALPLLRLRCAGEPLSVRSEDRRGREKRFTLSIERSGERAGQGVLALVHAEDASGFAREHAAPAWLLARGSAAATR